MYEKLENTFIKMICDHADELRSGKMPKGKFIGKYTTELNKADKENAFRFKYPQFLSRDEDPQNNWLDYIINMEEEQYYWFMSAVHRPACV